MTSPRAHERRVRQCLTEHVNTSHRDRVVTRARHRILNRRIDERYCPTSKEAS